MTTIITGTTNKPMASEQLRLFFNSHPDYSGYLYIGYPIIGTVNGAYPIDALWVSSEKGVVIFNLVEGKDPSDYRDLQDDSVNRVEAKLEGYRQLMDRRTLCVSVSVVTYAPTAVHLPTFDVTYPVCNESNLEKALDPISWDKPDYYDSLLSVLQSISTIRKGKKKREVLNPRSRGAKLRDIEDSIANLDNRQSHAVIETVDGVQRIRGLAGSGKTIVLALKAAYLHAQHPDWKIAVTFNTRSLKGQFRQLINTFFIEQTNEEPDWDNLNVIHAWGAPGGGERNGMYYTFCSLNNAEYHDYVAACNLFGSVDPFGKACNKALEEAREVKQIYDAILVDEAQDFSPGFLRLCYGMLKEKKRLVYAYDELQNLRSQSLPAPEAIFGTGPDGTPLVKFTADTEGTPQQDIILEKCYRNSRPALVTAHALGFGIYHKPPAGKESGLVQMFEQSSLWTDIGYEVADGKLGDGRHVVLRRTADSSPAFLESHSDMDDLILFKSFASQGEQDEWVAAQIKTNLSTDELRPDDIIVINPNPLTTRELVAPIRKKLYDERIVSHTAGVDTSPDVFFADNNDSVAFTGIYRAKGNEAAMVYVINAQDCFESSFELSKVRNQLFTAITRSKAWVRVLGVGSKMQGLIAEYNQVKDHHYTLDFIYPTKAQRDHMNLVNRDMSATQKRKVKKIADIIDMITELDNGQIYLEDLGEERIGKLRKLLNRHVGDENADSKRHPESN